MLTSLQNPLLKQIRKLHQTKERQRTGQMLLEGAHLVEAALETGWPLHEVISTETWAEANSEFWQKLVDHADHSEQVAEKLFPELVTTVNSPGILAIVPYGTRVWTACLARPQQLIIALENIQDAGNLGTILRTAAAVGVSGVILSPHSISPDHPKVLRATSGQWFRQPPFVADLPEVLTRTAELGYRILGTSSHATTTLWQTVLTGPLVLLFGSEGQGLSAALPAHTPLCIPQEPGVESLNLAVSAAVLLYEVRRQRELLL